MRSTSDRPGGRRATGRARPLDLDAPLAPLVLALGVAPGVALLAVWIAGCAPATDGAGGEARATLRNAAGETIGQVRLRDTAHGVLMHVALDGAPPGPHGFHLHERGICEPPFDSAGGHFAPRDSAHGFRADRGPHAGDLPNLFVPESGSLEVDLFSARVHLRDGPNTLLDADGSAFILHGGADDYSSQPSGAAGERIACGAVEAAEPARS